MLIRKELAGECSNEARFHEVVGLYLRELRQTPEELAGTFDMSTPSVRLWMRGRCAPHPTMRRRVYEKLERLLVSAGAGDVDSAP